MLLLIAAIGTTQMACDEGRQAFTPPRGPFSLHPLVAPVPVGPPAGAPEPSPAPAIEACDEEGTYGRRLSAVRLFAGLQTLRTAGHLSFGCFAARRALAASSIRNSCTSKCSTVRSSPTPKLF